MSWGNTDTPGVKPKFDMLREVREVQQLVTANSTASGVTVIRLNYNDGAQNNVANIGIAVGQYAYAANVSGNGVSGFFRSNNTVSAISGNLVTFSSATLGTIPSNTLIEFDAAIAYKANTQANTYFSDTVLVTPTRVANNTTGTGAIANLGSISQGWVHFQKKTNNDGTVRYLRETLVSLADPQAANTFSSNTSFGKVFSSR